MGMQRDEMEEAEAATQIGIEIARRAGVVDVCDANEHCYWLTGVDEKDAYKLASALVERIDASLVEHVMP